MEGLLSTGPTPSSFCRSAIHRFLFSGRAGGISGIGGIMVLMVVTVGY